ncbi:MAG: signal recognition particle receptor subunit alpha [Candidatus Hermodarchaeota archaeon]
MVLEELGIKLEKVLRKIKRLPSLDKEVINAIIQELQRSLLESDVKVELVLEMTENIRKEAMKTKLQKVRRKDFVIKLIHDELIKLLGGKPALLRIKPGKSNIILLVGIQGSGKTTTAAKLANYYKRKGGKIAVLTTDTWRPGAYEQLQQLSKQVGVKCYGNPNEKNTIKIAIQETKKAINDGHEIIIVDTAGRHKEEKELLKELTILEQKLKPNEIILVIDGTLGQQAFNQAEAFAQTTTLGSIIVTKLDGTAKGGGALSACAASNVGIRFIGVGEKISDFEEFEPSKFIGSLLGIINIESLIQMFEDNETDTLPKFDRRKFNLEDFYIYLKYMLKTGKFKQILPLIGLANIPDAHKKDVEANLAKWEVVLNSMTRQEKENPKIIKKTRKRRIAIGSGNQYSNINKMLDLFNQIKKSMKRIPFMQKKGKGKVGLDFMKRFGKF